jgi:hypothetical protein
MKRTGQTIEAEVLDSSYFKSGGESGWSVFGAERRSPAEILEDAESGGEDPGVRAAVMSVMISRCLEGWSRDCDVAAVGGRVLALARAVGFEKGFVPGVVVMRGVLGELGGDEGAAVARRVLGSWFWDAPGVDDLGKRVLAFGLFFNHWELEGWSVRSLSRALGESRTWTSKRVRRECNAPIEQAGGSLRAGWQQGEEQRRKTAAVARGRKRNDPSHRSCDDKSNPTES